MTQTRRPVVLKLTMLAVFTAGCAGADSDEYHEVVRADAAGQTSDPSVSTSSGTRSEEADGGGAAVAGHSPASTADGTAAATDPAATSPATTDPATISDHPQGTGETRAGDALVGGAPDPNANAKDSTASVSDGQGARTGDATARTGLDGADGGSSSKLPGGSAPGSPATGSPVPGSSRDGSGDRSGKVEPIVAREIKLLIPEKEFREEGPEAAIRVSFDDVDLLKVLNMEPVTETGLALMPKWMKSLNGKRIRIRGFMYPPFEETGLRGFVLARDNQICCFGRNPLVYDLVSVKMRDDVTTDYIENRPFDVVGILRIGDSVEPGDLYWMDDAIVIDR